MRATLQDRGQERRRNCDRPRASGPSFRNEPLLNGALLNGSSPKESPPRQSLSGLPAFWQRMSSLDASWPNTQTFLALPLDAGECHRPSPDRPSPEYPSPDRLPSDLQSPDPRLRDLRLHDRRSRQRSCDRSIPAERSRGRDYDMNRMRNMDRAAIDRDSVVPPLRAAPELKAPAALTTDAHQNNPRCQDVELDFALRN